MKKPLVVPLIVLSIILALGVGIAATAAIYVWSETAKPLSLPQEGAVIEVEIGSTLTGLARVLSQDGILVSSPLALRVYTRFTERRGHIKAGEYKLEKGMTTEDLLDLLRRGDVIKRTVTFVEGWTFKEWRSELQSEEHLEQTLKGVTDTEILEMLDSGYESPEGLFFPDTYQYTKGESDLAILKRAFNKMDEVLTEEWLLSSHHMAMFDNRYDVLILASIVEKESGDDADRQLVASVFHNRLAKNMRLQSDPTVIYGIKNFDGNLTRAHLGTASTHNTYVNHGLPPTPICNPGLASIRATLNPAQTNYYYFVAKGDGGSEFSETLEEHNAAVARFQKAGRVKNYRSRPSDTDNEPGP